MGRRRRGEQNTRGMTMATDVVLPQGTGIGRDTHLPSGRISCMPSDPSRLSAAPFDSISAPAVRLTLISGSRSGAGKTYLGECLLRALDRSIGIKARAQEGPLRVTVETPDSAAKGKDTGRFLAAGAHRAFFVRGPVRPLKEEVQRIMRNHPDSKVVLESNALADEIDSDLSLFVWAPGSTKAGSEDRMNRCDAVIVNE